ncbi:RNA guanine-N7 methyltransferase activating subunit-like [Daphnia pulicaria]|jgi:RNMT-activating mini protein|uniref:RNA guanine-N7 methyltransferase activating subunit-like n=1 Tax=Daphnia pulicaria TaxID=35523 RepID=UPI001EEA6AA8|nr:RNA guanine-N7 methyltransferase activating subunit-like [Daphnia pulicaria]
MELTEEQKCFLAECEEEFSQRYTENDAEFMKLKNKPLSNPPIVDPWGNNFNRNQQRGEMDRGGGYRGQRRPYGRRQRDYRDSYSRHDSRQTRDRHYDDRSHHRDRSYEDRGQDRTGQNRGNVHHDREDGHHQPRYHPY